MAFHFNNFLMTMLFFIIFLLIFLLILLGGIYLLVKFIKWTFNK